MVDTFHCVRARFGGKVELSWTRTIAKMLDAPASDPLDEPHIAAVSRPLNAEPASPVSPSSPQAASNSPGSQKQAPLGSSKVTNSRRPAAAATHHVEYELYLSQFSLGPPARGPARNAKLNQLSGRDTPASSAVSIAPSTKTYRSGSVSSIATSGLNRGAYQQPVLSGFGSHESIPAGPRSVVSPHEPLPFVRGRSGSVSTAAPSQVPMQRSLTGSSTASPTGSSTATADNTIALRLRLQRAIPRDGFPTSPASSASPPQPQPAPSPRALGLPTRQLSNASTTSSSGGSTLYSAAGTASPRSVDGGSPLAVLTAASAAAAANAANAVPLVVPVPLAKLQKLCIRARLFRFLLAQHERTLTDLSEQLGDSASETPVGSPEPPTATDTPAADTAWDAASLSTSVAASFLPPTTLVSLSAVEGGWFSGATVMFYPTGAEGSPDSPKVVFHTRVNPQATQGTAQQEQIPLFVAYALGCLDDDAAYGDKVKPSRTPTTPDG
ncbi:hypothetical protein HK405_010595, partial [Cladochytrium tenue]